MDIFEVMRKRHSVRSYLDKPIEPEKIEMLKNYIDAVNFESGLNIQLQTNEPNGFSGILAKTGSFENVKNYIVLCGKNDKDREIGYFGEKIVLYAQSLGLNTCWVAVTYNKRKAVYTLKEGEKLYIVISLGYGKTEGVPHKQKKITAISNVDENSPEYFKRGIEAVLLAPTAMNQQKFFFTHTPGKIVSKAGIGPYTDMDLGIAQYHFDAGARGHYFGL